GDTRPGDFRSPVTCDGTPKRPRRPERSPHTTQMRTEAPEENPVAGASVRMNDWVSSIPVAFDGTPNPPTPVGGRANERVTDPAPRPRFLSLRKNVWVRSSL